MNGHEKHPQMAFVAQFPPFIVYHKHKHIYTPIPIKEPNVRQLFSNKPQMPFVMHDCRQCSRIKTDVGSKSCRWAHLYTTFTNKATRCVQQILPSRGGIWEEWSPKSDSQYGGERRGLPCRRILSRGARTNPQTQPLLSRASTKEGRHEPHTRTLLLPLIRRLLLIMLLLLLLVLIITRRREPLPFDPDLGHHLVDCAAGRGRGGGHYWVCCTY